MAHAGWYSVAKLVDEQSVANPERGCITQAFAESALGLTKLRLKGSHVGLHEA